MAASYVERGSIRCPTSERYRQHRKDGVASSQVFDKLPADRPGADRPKINLLENET